ncbi:alginate lyase family protein [Marispirochaeta aestuarii]|uniref:heparinase II/III family protein n=1 Tax=Marispirochaeta aestuarii TaxID=1963862 RepID=UPI0029C7460B|nr:alginate lyase family protein [Marispirochaeta aestuarii]
MKISFILRRLQKMSLLEILYRCRKIGKGIVEKIYYQQHPVKLQGALNSKIIINIPEIPSKIIKRKADDTLSNIVNIFNREYKFQSSEWDFHRDPETGKKLPWFVWGKSIDYHDSEKVGNIKCLWELNRFTYIFPLVYQFKQKGEIKYLDKIKSLILTWEKQNPFLKGINWCSSLEAAIRVINWSFLLSSLRGFFDDSMSNRIQLLIYQHVWFIRRNLSLFSSANNHLIGELIGIYIGSVVLPTSRKAKKWKEYSYKKLIKQLHLQFYADGMNKEQAFYYQHSVIDLYLIMMSFATKYGDPILPFEKVVRKSLSALYSVSYDDKNVPQVGDADDAVTLDMGQKEIGVYYSLFSTMKSLWGNSRVIEEENGDIKTEFYSLNIGRINSYKRVRKNILFEKAGYCVLRDRLNKTFLLFCCGPLGYRSIAAHGHADANSFFLSVKNKPVFIDTGTYAYHDLPEWRNYFRSTRAHNSLTINGLSQSEMLGAFMWGKKAHTKISVFDQNRVNGRHDGFSSWNERVWHEREIRIKENGNIEYEIADKISGSKQKRVDLFFHVSPEFHTIEEFGNKLRISSLNVHVFLEFEPWLNYSIIKGQIDPVCGWYSNSFYQKEEISTIILNGITKNDQTIITKVIIETE